ncbi:MAG: NAD(P)/FAD-dependent oxidoreductase [Gammaproteobacteria bacterium]
MKIAIVGSGVAGNVAAYRLHREHDITVFEADDRPGGHTHTHVIEIGGREYRVDTGFIVFNEWTYPSFIELLAELGVESRPSHMSFSVRCERSGLEYNGTSLSSLFAQRRNLLRPSFHRMLRDILRFNREAPRLLAPTAADISLGDYLQEERYSRELIDHYLVPMGAAIWSAQPRRILEMPARFLIRFFHNHGMLSVNRRPQWRAIQGGSQAYLHRLIAPFRHRLRTAAPVTGVRRHLTQVEIELADGTRERFDHVFLACHSDQALRLLRDPTTAEREVLGAIPYQDNEVVLHTDTRLLPRRKLAWAAWNYHVLDTAQQRAAVTYNMNILQGLDAPETLCVTLNRGADIDPRKVIKRLHYAHPMFTRAAVAAQARHGEIDGACRTWYCGAYWRYGFHEDGVVSALEALRHFNRETQHAQLPLQRVG